MTENEEMGPKEVLKKKSDFFFFFVFFFSFEIFFIANLFQI